MKGRFISLFVNNVCSVIVLLTDFSAEPLEESLSTGEETGQSVAIEQARTVKGFFQSPLVQPE